MSDITRNAVKCKLCGDEIESKHRHDFRSCGCGRVMVDGGKDYLKRCYPGGMDPKDAFEELSTFAAEPADTRKGDANG